MSKCFFICIFYSFLVWFKNSSLNFSEIALRLVFAFATFVSFDVSGVGAGADWNVDSKVGSRVEVLSQFCIGHNLLLKLLRTFSLVLKIIQRYSINTFFQLFYTFIKIL